MEADNNLYALTLTSAFSFFARVDSTKWMLALNLTSKLLRIVRTDLYLVLRNIQRENKYYSNDEFSEIYVISWIETWNTSSVGLGILKVSRSIQFLCHYRNSSKRLKQKLWCCSSAEIYKLSPIILNITDLSAVRSRFK
jgi:hypothetical protein